MRVRSLPAAGDGHPACPPWNLAWSLLPPTPLYRLHFHGPGIPQGTSLARAGCPQCEGGTHGRCARNNPLFHCTFAFRVPGSFALVTR